MNPLLALLRRLAMASTFNFDIEIGFTLSDLFTPGIPVNPELPIFGEARPEDFMDDPQACEGCGMTVDPEMGCVEGEDDEGFPFYYHLDCAPVEPADEEGS